MHYAETEYGFEFGAAKVKRICSFEERGWVMLAIETPKHDNLEVYVTKTGKVRIFSGHKEWKCGIDK